ncbi:hypothetical protein OEZ85_003345 [Tetradesmus obliquus]|uniref:MYND-type domain-containing protein n=1 Tax=Tetradesmus obliquus TaxID=3088 RepID=A0ABY8UAZ8_TETOB|nr:hypothetical protein OEZ85_003345 [Tetradesmus obliquus]
MKCAEQDVTDGLARRKLLNKAFGKVQQGLKHATAADGLVNPSALPELPNNAQQLLSNWGTEEVFSAKDCFLVNSGEDEEARNAEPYKNAWFVARRTLQAWVLEGGPAGSPLLLKAPGGMGCKLSVLRVRDVAGGKASLMELRADFFLGRGFSAAAAQPTEPDALRLLSALLAANRELLPGDYLHTLCKVCSKERANKCAGCGQAAYCSKECQTQDWPSHKALCKQLRQQYQQQQQQGAAGADADRGIGSSPHIVADLTAVNTNMAALFQCLSGAMSITRANQNQGKGALRKPHPQQRFVVQLAGFTQQEPGPTFDVQLMSNMQRPGVCQDLLQQLQQRGSAARDSGAGRGPRHQLCAWAVLEAADRLCIITDQLPSQQQSWGRRDL